MGPTGSFIVFGVQLLFFTDTVDSWEAGDAGLVLAGTQTVFFGWCWVFSSSLWISRFGAFFGTSIASGQTPFLAVNLCC